MKKRRKAQFHTARAYFAQLRSLLLLDHFMLTFEREPPDDPNACAHIRVMETRNVATIRLGEGYYRGSREQRRHYAVHELLHIHLARLDYAVGDAKHAIDDVSWATIYRGVVRQLELSVDALADVLAPLLPLPPEEDPE